MEAAYKILLGLWNKPRFSFSFLNYFKSATISVTILSFSHYKMEGYFVIIFNNHRQRCTWGCKKLFSDRKLHTIAVLITLLKVHPDLFFLANFRDPVLNRFLFKVDLLHCLPTNLIFLNFWGNRAFIYYYKLCQPYISLHLFLKTNTLKWQPTLFLLSFNKNNVFPLVNKAQKYQ